MEGCGYKVTDACLMHINKQYEYDGKKYNLKKLFTTHSLKEEIRIFEKELPVLLAGQWKVLALKKAPDVLCGTCCSSPFGCEFNECCHEGQTDDWVGNMPGIGNSRMI